MNLAYFTDEHTRAERVSDISNVSTNLSTQKRKGKKIGERQHVLYNIIYCSVINI